MKNYDIKKITDALLENNASCIAQIQSKATPAEMAEIMTAVKSEMKRRQEAIANKEAKKLGYF